MTKKFQFYQIFVLERPCSNLSVIQPYFSGSEEILLTIGQAYVHLTKSICYSYYLTPSAFVYQRMHDPEVINSRHAGADAELTADAQRKVLR